MWENKLCSVAEKQYCSLTKLLVTETDSLNLWWEMTELKGNWWCICPPEMTIWRFAFLVWQFVARWQKSDCPIIDEEQNSLLSVWCRHGKPIFFFFFFKVMSVVKVALSCFNKLWWSRQLSLLGEAWFMVERSIILSIAQQKFNSRVSFSIFASVKGFKLSPW